MNRTTKLQREQRIEYAERLVKLDDFVCVNADEVCDELMSVFGISRDSAKTAVMHAIVRARQRKAHMDDPVL